MIPRQRNPKIRRMVATHLKLVGVRPSILTLYKKALLEFFAWRRSKGIVRCKSFAELDAQMAEDIIFSFEFQDPLYKATNAWSGLERFFPQARRHFELSVSYYTNWTRVVVRKRALPLAPDWARAFLSFLPLRSCLSTACLCLWVLR